MSFIKYVTCFKKYIAKYRPIDTLLSGIINSLPNRCILCHQNTNDNLRGLCSYCLAAEIYQGFHCLSCAKPIDIVDFYCGACLLGNKPIIIAPASYHSKIGPLVAALKYQRQFAPLSILIKALIDRITLLNSELEMIAPQVIIPVPMHQTRLKQRGFNQAFLIAKEIANHLALPLDSESLIRTRNTTPQASLDGNKRRKNLVDAFSLDSNFPYQRIALIDDVVTTGTTVNEISRLFEKRYIHVQVWCLARSEYTVK